MSGRPLIAVTAIPRTVVTVLGVARPQATVDAAFGTLVAAAGGIPVFVDACADAEHLAQQVDGVLVGGGSDLSPSWYGEGALSTTDAPDILRDEFEIDLVRSMADLRKPVLGICRGMQVLNVAFGGSLHQHLPDHTTTDHFVITPFDRPVHSVNIHESSILASALKCSELAVNSIHHQGVHVVGRGLRATAWAPDGTIEAIEDSTGRLLGIQWHPEFIAGDSAAAEQTKFFELLVRAARRNPDVSRERPAFRGPEPPDSTATPAARYGHADV